jgi:hypothetical protein
MLSIEENPTGQVYYDLIDLAFVHCDEFHLVLRKDMGSLKSFQPILQKLEPSLKEIKEQSEWASTILLRHTAYVYYYHTDEHAKKMLKEISDSLYGWMMPDLPEDLSFFKRGKVWMATSSHEEWCCLYPENFEGKEKYLTEKIMGIEGLKVTYIEE